MQEPMTRPPVRYRTHDGSIISLPIETKTDLPRWEPPEQPSAIRKFIGNLLTARYGGNPVLPTEQQTAPRPVSAKGAMQTLQLMKVKVQSLRMAVGEISGKAVPHHKAEQNYRDAVDALNQLEQSDVDAAARHALDGTTDTGMADRARAISDAEQRAVAASRARQVAAAAIKRSDADMKPVMQELQELERQWPHIQRAALLEMLEELAPAFEQEARRMYGLTVQAFAISKALGSLLSKTGGNSCGDGLGNHLTLPTPDHPSYRFTTVPNAPRDIAQEAARIMEDLKA